MTLILTQQKDEFVIYKQIKVTGIQLPTYFFGATLTLVELPHVKDPALDKDQVIKCLREQTGEEVIYKNPEEIDKRTTIHYNELRKFEIYSKIITWKRKKIRMS